MTTTTYPIPIESISTVWWRWDRDDWHLHFVSFYDDGKCYDDPRGFELEKGVYSPCLPPEKLER
jgi:hypothetical protein